MVFLFWTIIFLAVATVAFWQIQGDRHSQKLSEVATLYGVLGIIAIVALIASSIYLGYLLKATP